MTATGGLWRNWGRSESARPARVERPVDADAVVRAVRAAVRQGHRVKAVGSGHSFSGVAVAPGVLLELGALSGITDIDLPRRRVTIAAGTRLHQLPRLLRPYGLALENMGDIDRQTLAGATSTGTHGTGGRFGGLATQITGVRIVTAEGELKVIDETESPELLPAVRLGLGALGVLVDLTIQCVPAFVLEAVERPEPLEAVLESYLERSSAADHFEFYWFPHTETALTKTNTRLPGDAERHPLGGLRRLVDDELLANGIYRLACATGAAIPAVTPPFSRLAQRLTGNRTFTDLSPEVFVTDRRVRFREMEYALPRAEVPAVLREIRAMIQRRSFRISFPLEVRSAAADDNWMSTAYRRESGYIAVHRYFREKPEAYFRAVEEIMVAHNGRPHWGKMHYRDAESLRPLYPRFDDFRAVRDQLDPRRVFGNPYLSRVLGD